MLSCDFLITCMLAYSMTKRHYNCINLFPCILWEFIVRDEHERMREIAQDVQVATGSWLDEPQNCYMWGAHARRWRVRLVVTAKYSRCSWLSRALCHNLHQLRVSYELPLFGWKCDFSYSSHTHYIYPHHYPQKLKRGHWEKNHREVSTTHPPY